MELFLIEVWPTKLLGGLWTYQRTEVFYLRAELVTIFLLFVLNPSLHHWGFEMLSSGPEWMTPCSHFINQAAKAPPIDTHPVILVAHHLRSWN